MAMKLHSLRYGSKNDNRQHLNAYITKQTKEEERDCLICLDSSVWMGIMD